MICHAGLTYPDECCGLLVGSSRSVAAAIPMPNVSRTPRTRFEVDAASHIALRRILRRLPAKVGVVGVYHSHPDGRARLSERDLEDAHYDGWVHIVIGGSPGQPRLGAYRVLNGRPFPLKIRRG
jgi:proteasome lid subunit RPN8/RPN11